MGREGCCEQGQRAWHFGPLRPHAAWAARRGAAASPSPPTRRPHLLIHSCNIRRRAERVYRTRKRAVRVTDMEATVGGAGGGCMCYAWMPLANTPSPSRLRHSCPCIPPALAPPAAPAPPAHPSAPPAPPIHRRRAPLTVSSASPSSSNCCAGLGTPGTPPLTGRSACTYRPLGVAVHVHAHAHATWVRHMGAAATLGRQGSALRHVGAHRPVQPQGCAYL